MPIRAPRAPSASPPGATAARYAPTVIQMAAPLVVSFWMRAVVTFIDTIYAATIGDSAVAAIGITIPLEFLMIAVWVGTSTGLTSALSRAMGAREARKIDQYIAMGWRFVWVISPVFTAIGGALWFVAPHMGIASDVTHDFQIYGTVLIAGSAFTTFWSIIPDSLIKAHQDTRSTMWAGIWSNVVNVALNTFFLFVLHWGIFGIALSTVIGRLGGLAYAIVQANRHESARRAASDHVECEPDPRPHRAILGLAIPASLTFVLMSLETALVNLLLSRLEHPTAAIAAYAIYYRVVLFALQPVIALGVAILPYAARRFGERDLAGVTRGLGDAVRVATLYTLAIVGPIMLWLAPWIASKLAESEFTARYATFALYLVPLACFASAPFLLCRPVFEAMNRGRPGLIMAAFRYLVLTAPLAWCGLGAARQLGHPPLYGLLIGLLIAAGVSSLVFYGWLRRTLLKVAYQPGQPVQREYRDP